MAEGAELVYIPFSPWSRPVTWALFVTGVKPRMTPYTPSPPAEYWLRWRLGAWGGKVTTPLLFTRTGVLRESFQIAEWIGDQAGPGAATQLFPGPHAAEVRLWAERADTTMAYCRSATFALMLRDKECRRAFREKVTPPLAALEGVPLLGSLVDVLSLYFIRGFAAKYGDVGAAATEEKVVAALQALAEAVKGGERETLWASGLSYADIKLAVALDDPTWPKDPRAPAVQKAMRELKPWSEALFAKHYPQRQEAP